MALILFFFFFPFFAIFVFPLVFGLFFFCRVLLEREFLFLLQRRAGKWYFFGGGCRTWGFLNHDDMMNIQILYLFFFIFIVFNFFFLFPLYLSFDLFFFYKKDLL